MTLPLSSRFSAPTQAILLMLSSMAVFSAMNIAIRLVSTDLDSGYVVLLRTIFSLGITLLWSAFLHRGRPRFPTARLQSHFWRAGVGIIAMELWFHAVTLLPLTLATALSFTTPIYSTIIAIVFLREKAGLRRWAAIGMGFVGVMVILRPGFIFGTGDISADALYVLGSSVMMAVASVLVKTLSRTESPETIVFYMALFMLPWAIFPALGHIVPLSLYQLWLIFLVALFSTGAHLLMARAYMRADMVMLMPFDFSRLVFTAIMAYALFGETLDGYTVVGSLIIVGSTVYIAQREAALKRRATTTEELPGT
ncbi:MAG: DMT family transporter [Rickettsiales bacterium]|nr:DMT family transporter [Rickettsiales bacterium]